MWVLVALIGMTLHGPVAQQLSVLYCNRKRLGVRTCGKTNVFLPQIKLNCIPSGVLLDYMWSPAQVLRDWIRSPGKVSILMESIRILSGGYLEFTRIH